VIGESALETGAEDGRQACSRRIVIYERVGIFLSAVAILLGLGMIGATLARIGPSFSVGVVPKRAHASKGISR